MNGALRINSDDGLLTIATGNITGAGQNLTIGGATDTKVSVVIGTATGALTKDGAGTLTLLGANTYSGGTTVSGGALQGTTTSLQGNITDDASLVFDQATTGTYAGVISGTGSVTKQNTGNLTFSGTNSYGGGTSITGGALTVSGATAAAGSGTIDIDANTLNINNGAALTNALTITTGTIGNTAGPSFPSTRRIWPDRKPNGHPPRA